MKIIIVVSCLLVCALAAPQDDWIIYKSKFRKSYATKEDTDHMAIYTKRMNRFAKHNQDYKDKKVHYKVGPNKYSDMPLEEFEKKMMGLKEGPPPPMRKSGREDDVIEYLKKAYKNYKFPESFNLAEIDAVTPVKDQYPCGSCYTFSATAALETALVVQANQPLRNLSAQELVDCTYQKGNYGCNGGWMTVAFKYVTENMGISDWDSYDYKGEVGECAPRGEKHGRIFEFAEIPRGREDLMQAALYHYGALAIAYCARGVGMADYKGGIYDDEQCCESLTHAVTLVGWGREDGIDYWLIKNSWGTTWGEEGYLKLRRGINHCGVANMVSFPVVNPGGVVAK